MGYDGTLKFDTSIDSSGFQSGIKKISGLASGALKTTGKIVAGASISIAGLGAAAIKVGSDFESGMSKVQAISNASADEIAKLTDKAKEMGAKTKFSAGESAEAFQYMAMAGWQTEEMLDGISGVMNLAAASGEDLATTSDIVTDAITAFGLKAQDAGKFADILAQASSKANTNVSMMGETFKYVAPVAGSLGFSAEDCAVAIGLMANSGIKASQAGTSLRSVFTRMAKPTKEVQVAMDKLGISITNSDGSMKSLNVIMKDLRRGFKDLTQAEKAQIAASLGGQEAMSGLLAIVNASEEDFNSLTESIYNSEGAAERMAGTMMDNLQGAVEEAGGAIETFGLTLYEHMQKPAKETVQAITGMIDEINTAFSKDGFEGLAKSFGDNLAELAQMAVKSAPSLVEGAVQVIESFTNGIMDHSDEFATAGAELITALVNGMFSVSGTLWSSGIMLCRKILEGMAENSSEIGTKAGEMVRKILDAFTENAPLIIQAGRDFVSGFFEGMSEEFPGIASLVKGFVEGFADTALSMIEPIAKSVQALFNVLNDTDPAAMEATGKAIGTITAAIVGLQVSTKVIGSVSALLKILGNAKGTIIGVGATIGKVVEGFALWAGGAGTLGEVIALQFPKLATFGATIGKVATSVTGFFTNFGSVLGGVSAFIGGAITAVTNFVDMFKNGFDIVKEILMTVGIAIAAVGAVILGAPAAIAAVVAGIVWAVSNLAIAIKENWTAIVDFFRELPDKIGETVDAIVAWFQTLPERMAEWLSVTVENVKQWGTDVLQNASDFAKSTIDAVVTFFNELPGKIGYALGYAIGKVIKWGQDVGTWVATNVPLIIEKIVAFFRELPGKVWTWLKNTYDKLVSWGAEMLTTAREKASECINAIVSFFSGLPGKVWTWLSNTAQKVASWGRDMVQKGRQAAVDLVNAVVSCVRNLPSKMYSIGSDIVRGLWNGIKNMGGWIKRKIGDFFSGIVKGAKKSLGIRSPSRVFANEVGKWIPPGVGEGIEHAMPELEKQTDAELKGLAEKMSRTVQVETGKFTIEKNANETYKLQKEAGQSFTETNVDVSINGETHVHVDLDKEEIGHGVTPIVDEDMAVVETHKNRGG